MTTDSIISFPDIKEIESQAALWVMRADENGLSAQRNRIASSPVGYARR
jgi:hypothetical protein